ncbi:MAG: peroxiredoxin [Bacteroidetes bacterium]|nr:peroxiredoxin [Bacteroidota bacterium]MCB0847076.1 peroxiredoxin [Bacteroidota bacterium]
MEKVALGSVAPDFELKDQNDELVKLSDFIGKKNIVLYFYPKDETPGCTKEACGFRDQYEDFTAIGAEVIGVSADSVESHKNFALNRKLPFVLLSDPDNKVRKSYGVKGSLLGLLPGRETFVIDKEGIVRHRFSSQFQIDNHIGEALEVLKGLDG